MAEKRAQLPEYTVPSEIDYTNAFTQLLVERHLDPVVLERFSIQELLASFSPVVQAIIVGRLFMNRTAPEIAEEWGISANLVHDYITRFWRSLNLATYANNQSKPIVDIFNKFIQRGNTLQRNLENQILVTEFWEEFGASGDDLYKSIAYKLIDLVNEPVTTRATSLRQEEAFTGEELKLIWYALVSDVNLLEANPRHIRVLQVLYKVSVSALKSQVISEANKALFRIFIAAYSQIETFRPDLVSGLDTLADDEKEEESTGDLDEES